MAANSVVPYDGYPQAAGAKIESAGDFFGTANYQAGGYNITPGPFGFTRFEHVMFSQSQSNNYFARVRFPANGSVNTELRSTGAATATVLWYAANGTEAANNANLATEALQFYARGI